MDTFSPFFETHLICKKHCVIKKKTEHIGITKKLIKVQLYKII